MTEAVGDHISNPNGEVDSQSRLILDFRYRNTHDHSNITMVHLAVDCGLDETVPISVEETADEEWVTETWELLNADDEQSLALAQDVYAEFLTQVKILVDRGFAEIAFEVPEGQAGQDYFAPPPPSVQ